MVPHVLKIDLGGVPVEWLRWEEAATLYARERVRWEAGELQLMPPTVTNLLFLAAHHDVAAAMEAGWAVGTPPCILPKIRLDDTGRMVGIAMPGEPDYDALP